MQRKSSTAKNASIPSLRVDRSLRRSAESVLHRGETLSSFVEESLRDNIARRETQREFIARGLASLGEAQKHKEFLSAERVLRELRSTLFAARKTTKRL
jgi:predicted transcriptional regulator